MLQTPHKNRRQRKNLLSKARWAGYAAAGAAAVLGASESTEADIQTGYLGVTVDALKGQDNFEFDVNGDTKFDFEFRHGAFTYYLQAFGAADVMGFGLKDLVVGRKLGYSYVSNLLLDATVDANQPFIFGGIMASLSGVYGSQFTQPGIGYIGFTFEHKNGGTHYGWVKVNMVGVTHNAFTLLDYAYEDMAGKAIQVGPVPEPGSLGLLATGALGLLLWRRTRRGNKPAA